MAISPSTIQSSKILQIVPRLPPYSDGVGDYARLLAQQLSLDHYLETEFVAFRPGDKTPTETDGFRTHRLFQHSAAGFLSLVPHDIESILLHYSNFPYLQGKLDAPFWLVSVLKTLTSQRNLPLVVMYHELPTLKWKRVRVLNPVQTLVSRRLSRLANAVVTDSHHFKTHLEKWTDAPVTCIPDFSTIGEPQAEQVRSLSQRQPRLIIFGGSDRTRAYQPLDRLIATCEALGIQEICDIGTPQGLEANRFGAIAFKEMGFQPAETVRQLLLDSVAGFMDYSRFPGDLGKSSVFAAFCAHGVMPICTAYNPSEPDGVFASKQYAIAGHTLSKLSPQQRQNIADQARTWYNQHSLETNAQLFASHLNPPIKGPLKSPMQPTASI